MEKEIKQTGCDTKEKKIVNLFEDGNVHEHDKASYDKMQQHQKPSTPKK